jgi:hypothetical protein
MEWFKKRAKFTDENLLKELEITAPSDYKNFMRMEYSTLMELLDMFTPFIQKDTTVIYAISASQRLSATLSFLATGQSFEYLKFLTAIVPQTLGNIIIETCQAKITVLKDNIKVISLIYFYSLQLNITQAEKCRLKLFVG